MVSPWVPPCTTTVESNGAALAEPLVAADAAVANVAAANAGNTLAFHTTSSNGKMVYMPGRATSRINVAHELEAVTKNVDSDVRESADFLNKRLLMGVRANSGLPPVTHCRPRSSKQLITDL